MAAIAGQIAASAGNPDAGGLQIRRDYFLAAIEEIGARTAKISHG